jgi:hypothetical protein
LPGVKSANKALDYATPWIGQLRQLISKEELRGLVADLRPTVPDLAELSKASLPFLEEIRALSSCFNNVVIPWSLTPIPNNDGDPQAAQVFQEFAYGLTGVAGESRSGDANGQEFRVLGGGGTQTIAPFTSPDLSGQLTGVTPFEFLGSQPSKQSSAKTPFRPDVPCETQDPPDLRSQIGPAPGTSPTPTSNAVNDNPAAAGLPGQPELVARYGDILQQFADADKLKKEGHPDAANELLQQANDLFAAWGKDWMAFQKANGIQPIVPASPEKGAKR